jgi:hypothetical protein
MQTSELERLAQEEEKALALQKELQELKNRQLTEHETFPNTQQHETSTQTVPVHPLDHQNQMQLVDDLAKQLPDPNSPNLLGSAPMRAIESGTFGMTVGGAAQFAKGLNDQKAQD